jgi:hypothetical protein
MGHLLRIVGLLFLVFAATEFIMKFLPAEILANLPVQVLGMVTPRLPFPNLAIGCIVAGLGEGILRLVRIHAELVRMKPPAASAPVKS